MSKVDEGAAGVQTFNPKTHADALTTQPR